VLSLLDRTRGCFFWSLSVLAFAFDMPPISYNGKGLRSWCAKPSQNHDIGANQAWIERRQGSPWQLPATHPRASVHHAIVLIKVPDSHQHRRIWERFDWRAAHRPRLLSGATQPLVCDALLMCQGRLQFLWGAERVDFRDLVIKTRVQTAGEWLG
jgi:hypothetical protein